MIMAENEAYRKIAENVLEGLKKRNIEGFYCNDRKEALELALGLMEEKGSVSWGGSATVRELGILDILKDRRYPMIEYGEKDKKEIGNPIFQQAAGADYFLMSTNAVTVKGELVNIDGASNRVSSLLHGPKKVIIIAGINKVVRDVEAGIDRIQTSVCPVLAGNSGRKTPCGLKGICTDCLAEDCMCCNVVITRRSRYNGRIRLILVGENLGV